jgi:hypothetical protein
MPVLRKLLLTIAALAALAAGGAVAVLFFFGDTLILYGIRSQSAALAPLQLKIGAFHSRLLGPVELTIGDLEVIREQTKLKIRQAKLSSPLTLPGLYFAFRAKQELPLALVVSGMELALPAASPSGPTESGNSGDWPDSLTLPAALPLPVSADVQLLSGEASGPFQAKEISAKLSLRANAAGAELAGSAQLRAGAAGADMLVPVSAEWKLAATPRAVKLQHLSFKAAGLEGAAEGELSLQPVQGKGKIQVDAPDLSRLSLRPEDRAALGLTAQPAGAFSFQAEAEADAKGTLGLNGQLLVQNAALSLQSAHSVWGGLGAAVDGPVTLRAELPFRARLAWPYSSRTASVTSEKAALAADLSGAAIAKKGLLSKPKGIALKAELLAAGNEQGIRVDSLSLAFHTLQLSASGRLPSPLGQSFDASFRVETKSLAGFPALLPILLAESRSASLADAEGAIRAEGSLHVLAAAPAKSMVELKALEIRGLRLPLNFSSATMEAAGILSGAATAQGRYNAGDVNISRSSGTFDLSGLDLVLKDKLEKKRGRKLLLSFDAKGTPTRLDLRKLSLAADGLSASLSGAVAFSAKRAASLNLSSTAHAELGPLREYLPKLPVKISGGVFDSQLKLTGTWIPEGGFEKSPLAVSGKVTARLDSVVAPESPAAAAATPAAPHTPAPLLPDWPVARNADLSFRVDLRQLQRGPLEASSIAAQGTLQRGVFVASVGVGSTFGGKASLQGLTGSLLDPNLALSGKAVLSGIDLARAAAFVEPSYGKIVKGSLTADAAFRVPSLWSTQLLETVDCGGQAQIRGGYISTAPLDSLVNEKLKGIPGVGDKAKISTGGMAAEIRTQYRLAKGVATLRGLVATTPKRDELRLDGSLGLDFSCDLSGEAHLASAPVTGPIREANSDPEGRLVVPVRFHGNLKAPQTDIATGAIEAMLKKTAAHEGEKLKNKAIDAAKSKAKDALQNAAGGLFDQLKSGFGKSR